MNNKTAIVMGVSGQDGSLMSDRLIENTELNVVGVVRRQSNPNKSNYSQLLGNKRFTLESADLNDFVSISGLVKKYQPAYFINFAAQSHVHESWNTPINTFTTNAVGTLHCLEAIRHYAPRCRFYHASSSEMWGDVLENFQSETTPFRPRSVYGVSKVAAHYLTKVYRESYRLYAISGMLNNHEGIRRNATFSSRQSLETQSDVYGDVISRSNLDPAWVFKAPARVHACRDGEARQATEEGWRLTHHLQLHIDSPNLDGPRATLACELDLDERHVSRIEHPVGD